MQAGPGVADTPGTGSGARNHMLVKSRKVWELPYSEVTPEATYHSRRDFIKLAGLGTIGAVAGSSFIEDAFAQTPASYAPLPNVKKTAYTTDPKIDPINSFQ